MKRRSPRRLFLLFKNRAGGNDTRKRGGKHEIVRTDISYSRRGLHIARCFSETGSFLFCQHAYFDRSSCAVYDPEKESA